MPSKSSSKSTTNLTKVAAAASSSASSSSSLGKPSRNNAFTQKLLLVVANLAFSVCGAALLLAGYYLFVDTERILLSRLLCSNSEPLNALPQPLFYYVALALAGGGAVAIVAAMVGWWAVCLNTVCMLTIYFLIILILLLIEFSLCLAIVIWPHCIGLGIDETAMVKAVQGGYGVPGREQLTAAVDLAQTRFACCAINSDNDYDTSLWRLQSFGQREWAVPLTCCQLANGNEADAFLDPKPVNVTLCQSLERTTNAVERHAEGCFEKLAQWYGQQYVWFLAATLIIAVVEFVVILCIIWNCMRLSAPADVSVVMRHTSTGIVDFSPKQQQQQQPPQRSKRKSQPAVYSVQMEPSAMMTATDNVYTNNDIQHTNHLHNASTTTAACVNTLDVRRRLDYSSSSQPDFDDEEQLSPDGERRKVFVQPPELCQQRHTTNFRPHAMTNKYQYELARSYLV